VCIFFFAAAIALKYAGESARASISVILGYVPVFLCRFGEWESVADWYVACHCRAVLHGKRACEWVEWRRASNQ